MKHERGHPCFTPCVLRKISSGEPRTIVGPCSSTVVILRSSLAGVFIRSRTSGMSILGGLSNAWYMSKAKMDSHGSSVSMSIRKV